jgi:cytochrome c peroxidase
VFRIVLALLFALPVLVCGCNQSATRCDQKWNISNEQCDALFSMVLPLELPPSKGNAKADDEGAAALGFQIFFDARFSRTQEFRCASCHAPETSFDDARATSVALGSVSRNSPTLLNAARLTRFFWDGRTPLLWTQPLFAFEHPNEMDFTRLEIAHRINTSYQAMYQSVFGALPNLADGARFPPRGAPGMTEFDSMAASDQLEINRIAANVGKALEAYMRKLAAGGSAVDAYLLGETTALSKGAARGLGVFARAGCISCHNGPMLTDESFHRLNVPDAPGTSPDLGQAAHYQLESVFLATGPFYDGAPPSEWNPWPDASKLEYGFRTPSLRNIALSAPYGHSGVFATLEEVIDFHLADSPLAEGDRADVIEFLQSLNGAYPSAPWNDWPEH